MTNSQAYPDTFAAAVEYAENHHRETGELIETVPNSTGDAHFDLQNRTVAQISVDDKGRVVETVTCFDTQKVLTTRILVDPETIPPELLSAVRSKVPGWKPTNS